MLCLGRERAHREENAESKASSRNGTAKMVANSIVQTRQPSGCMNAHMPRRLNDAMTSAASRVSDPRNARVLALFEEKALSVTIRHISDSFRNEDRTPPTNAELR